MEEAFWKQKANVKWLVEGDKNTKFFHQTVQKRKQNLNIFRLKNDDGHWITDSNAITNTAIESFKNQLNGTHVMEAEHILNFIPSLITEDQNESLTKYPTIEEL